MNIEWDYQKAALNLRKHGIDFAEAAMILYDELAITVRDIAMGEERFITLGMDALARILVVVYTWRGDCIRIISARKATPRERQEYKGCP
ncbi:MAG: BrnT family toxin [Acidobacteria bacterium]|nr:BrnT family toxin [Acidobacteriota bacterium]